MMQVPYGLASPMRSPMPGLSAFRKKAAVWTPAKLFAASEQGAWYDPSDLSTLFQDAAGTTPVTAVEQPVGLMLDKSKGLVLGPELVENGGFSEGSKNWGMSNADATHIVTFAGGTVRYQSNTMTPVLSIDYLPTSLVPGKFYLATVVVSSRVSGSLKIDSVNNFPFSFGGTVGVFTGVFIAAGRSFSIVRNSANVDVTIDNISVRELPGNHAFQTTATSRPVLSARVNLLTKTEQFDDAAWTKNAATIAANTVVAPDGTLTGDALVEDSTTASRYVFNNQSVVSGTTYTGSVYVKQGGRTWLQLTFSTGTFGATQYANFDISTGVLGTVVGGTATITSVGNGWYRCTFTVACTTSGSASCLPVIGTSGTAGRLPTYTGDGTSGIYIWGASLVPADQADLPYQRVNTATDYDAGPAYPRYLRCDGIDDGMVTGTITPGTDKAQVFAGVRKLSDAASAALAELSTDAAALNGGLAIFAPAIGGSNKFQFTSRGTSAVAAFTTSTIFNAPITNVLTGLGDISGDRATLRVDGTQVAQSTADQGTGNYLAYPLYLFRSGGTTAPFNGHFYGGIMRFGDNLPIETIQQTEAWMNSKTQAIDWRDVTDSSSFRWNSATASPDAE